MTHITMTLSIMSERAFINVRLKKRAPCIDLIDKIEIQQALCVLYYLIMTLVFKLKPRNLNSVQNTSRIYRL
jgi:hypothetical protein